MSNSLKSKLIFALFAIGIPLMLLGQAVTIKKTSDYPNNPSPAAGDLFLIARTGVTNFNIRYDQLFSNVNVQGTSTINNLFVSNAFITNLYSSNAFFTNLTVFENTYTSNLYTTNIYASNAYITNLTFEVSHGGKLTVTNVDVIYVNAVTNFYFFSTNLFVDNTYVSNYFATNVFNNNFVSNYLFTNVFVTNQYVTNLYSTNVVNNNTTVSNFWQTNIFVNDTFVSNYFTTNIFNDFTTNIFNTFDTTIITNLFISTNLTVQNIYNTNLITENINVTTNFFFSSTNLFVNNSYVSNYFITNVFNDNTVSNYLITNVYTTNLYTTNLYSTNIINNNSYVSNFWQTNIFVTDTTVSNYFATNVFITTNVFISQLNLTNVTLYGGTTLLDSGTNFTLNIVSSGGGPSTLTPVLVSGYVHDSDVAKQVFNVDVRNVNLSSPFSNNTVVAIRGANFADSHDTKVLYTTHSAVGVMGYTTGTTTNNFGEAIGVASIAQTAALLQYGMVAISQGDWMNGRTNVGIGALAWDRTKTANKNIAGYFETFSGTTLTNIYATDGSAIMADVRNTTNMLLVLQKEGVVKLKVDNSGVLRVTGMMTYKTSWSGPTNNIDVTTSDLYYTTLGALSVTGFSGTISGYGSSVQLNVYNGSGSNVDMTLPAGTIQGEGASGAITLTNGTRSILWFKIVPGELRGTNVAVRKF